MGIPVWLDCDPGHDDAIAILLAVHLPNIDLLGVSASSCNAPVHLTAINAARILYTCGAPSLTAHGTRLLVYSGAPRPLLRTPRHDPEIHGGDGLGGVEGLPPADDPAVQAFIAPTKDPGDTIGAIRRSVLGCLERGEDMVLVVTGAQTNVALFVLAYPSLIGKGKGVRDIVFMGGTGTSVGIGNRAPTAEFNILADPEAAGVVCDAECRVVMIGLDVTHTAIWHKQLHHFLMDPHAPSGAPPSQAATPFRHTLTTLFNFFAASYSSVFAFDRGPPIHDALCLLYVSSPELFKGKRYRVDVERSSGFCDGTTVIDVWDDRGKEFEGVEGWGRKGKNVWVAEKLDVSAGWQMLLRAIHEADTVSPLNKGIGGGLPWVEAHPEVTAP